MADEAGLDRSAGRVYVTRTGQRHHSKGCGGYRLVRVDWARIEPGGNLSHLTPCRNCGGGRGPSAHEREPPPVCLPAAEAPQHELYPAAAALAAATAVPAAAAAVPPAPTAASADVDGDSSSSSDDDDEDDDGDDGSGGGSGGSGGGAVVDYGSADESKADEESITGPPVAARQAARSPAVALAVVVANQVVHAAVLAVTAAPHRSSSGS